LAIRTRAGGYDARYVSDAVGCVESIDRRCSLIQHFPQVLRNIHRAMRSGIHKARINAVAGAAVR
jgi:hypothetical protein